MARYAAQYDGERRSKKVTVQLTPSERATLSEAATAGNMTLSEYARDMCLRRSAAVKVVAGTKRGAQAKALARQLTSLGNNLNQLTKRAHIDRASPQIQELKQTTDLLKLALSRVLTL